MHETRGVTQQRGMDVSLEQRHPSPALIPRGRVAVPFELGFASDGTEPLINPCRDHMRSQELPTAVLSTFYRACFLDCIRRRMKVRQAPVQRALGRNVPAHAYTREPAQREVRLPLEALDVRAQHIRCRRDFDRCRRVDP